MHAEALERTFFAEWGAPLATARETGDALERQKAHRQGVRAIIFALLLALLLLSTALVLFLLSSRSSTDILRLAIAMPMVPALYGLWSLLRTPDPIPDPSDISGSWWRTVSGRRASVRRSGPALEARDYGDEGERAFLSHLSNALPDGYVALRGALVARNLDADLVVVGPTGVWVFEVKHWSGEITCQNGEWRRTKTYRERGGRLVREVQALRPFDRQWAKEAGAVRNALRLKLPEHAHLREAVGGGLVFTHGRFSFHADGSCGARVFTPKSCAEAMTGSPGTPTLTMEERLRVVDALLELSDKLHEQQGAAPWDTSSAIELARQLHDEAVWEAQIVIHDVSASSEGPSVIPGKAVQESQERATYLPHPDDPPRD